MTLTLPTVFPVGYAGDYTDFFRVKCGRDGRMSMLTGQINLPSAVSTGVLIGIMPYQAGFKLSYGSFFQVSAMGTSVTLALGYQNYDSTAPGTSATAGYLAASSVASGGGTLNLNNSGVVAGAVYDALSNGWVTALTGGLLSNTSATLTYNLIFSYDQSGVQN